MAEILDAKFITSAKKVEQSPPSICAESAFIGRSNVGKSTLINLLTNKKSLAKSSSTPGKTRLLNFFGVTFRNENSELIETIFVDLPGFGYAKVSKKEREEWGAEIVEFLKSRESLKLFLMLIDSRHIDQKNDLMALEMLQKIKRDDQKILKVFTKCDKLKRSDFHKLKSSQKDGVFVSSGDSESIKLLRDNIYSHLFL